jgi:protein TonB
MRVIRISQLLNGLQMPVQTLARPFAASIETVQTSPPHEAAFLYPVPARRTVYQPKRMNPLSAVAAVTLAAATFSSLHYLGNLSPHRKHEQRLTILNLANLAEPPPPPARQKAEPKQSDAVPRPRAAIVTPKPLVEAPTPLPAVAVTEISAPPVPTSTTVETPQAPIAEVKPAAPSASTTDAGDLSSKMISATPPRYPVESRRLREQGTVILAVLLSLEGRVERISIARSSGFARLDRAAYGAVRHWRWSPTIHNGHPALVRGNVVIPFVLRVGAEA